MERNTFRLDIKDRVENYVSHGIEEEILNQVFTTIPSIHVMYAPKGSGKSSLVTHVAKIACERNQTSGVFIVNDYQGVNKRCSFNGWFLIDNFGLHEDTNKMCLSDCLPISDRPYLLILDQFDEVVDNPSVKRFVKPLAQELRMKGNLVCLICVNCREHYKSIIEWNGGEKIVPLGVSLKGTSLEESIWNPLAFLNCFK